MAIGGCFPVSPLKIGCVVPWLGGSVGRSLVSYPKLGIEPTTYVCALTRDQTRSLLVHETMLQTTEPPDSVLPSVPRAQSLLTDGQAPLKRRDKSISRGDCHPGRTCRAQSLPGCTHRSFGHSIPAWGALLSRDRGSFPNPFSDASVCCRTWAVLEQPGL